MRDTRQIWLTMLALLATTALVLWWMGRTPLCSCGEFRLWPAAGARAEYSQQLTDWYTLSHLIHGFLLYGALWLWAGGIALHWRMVIAATIEAAWELFENSSVVIDHYRAAEVMLGAQGDSVVNSLADIVTTIAGFALAQRLPVRSVVALALALELLAAWAMRDGLVLIVLQRVWPTEAISAWQAGLG